MAILFIRAYELEGRRASRTAHSEAPLGAYLYHSPAARIRPSFTPRYTNCKPSLTMASKGGNSTALRRLMKEYQQLTSQGMSAPVPMHRTHSLEARAQEPPMACSKPVRQVPVPLACCAVLTDTPRARLGVGLLQLGGPHHGPEGHALRGRRVRRQAHVRACPSLPCRALLLHAAPRLAVRLPAVAVQDEVRAAALPSQQ